MDRTERFYKIDNLLQSGRAVPVARLLEDLEVSLATFKRDIEYMRDRLNSPIVWDREERGYRYARQAAAAQQPLPGLWFNASEAYALLMMQSLLKDMQPGLLGAHIKPLRARLRAVIESGNHPAADVESRVKLLTVATRPVPDKHFEVVAGALLQGLRLKITYFSRGRNESGEREISPQMLVHYRGNWYLVAWCHKQEDLRSFAIDSIENATALTIKTKAMPKREIDSIIGNGYGIFSGSKVKWATLCFSAERARWVAREVWHPKQKLDSLSDGRLVMDLPFTDSRELVMDILRHGPHVEVINPPELKLIVIDALKHALDIYSGGNNCHMNREPISEMSVTDKREVFKMRSLKQTG